MGIAAAAGIGISVGAIKQYIGSTIDAIAETNALATRIGWSAESFQQLTYAARKSHVGQDELAVSLGQMSKRLGEVAIEGTGPAANALKRFGVNAQQLAALGPEKAFGVILKIFEKIQNPMERSAVAMDLFGRSGQGMINIIAQGGPALEQMKEEASRVGFALNGIDNAKVMEAKEALIDLSLAGEGFANMLAVKVAPYLTLVIEKYTEWAYSGTKSADWINRGLNIVVGTIGTVINGINVIQTTFYGVRAAVDSFISAWAQGLELVLSGIQTLIRGTIQAAETLGISLNAGVFSVVKTLDDSIKGFGDTVKTFRQGMDAAANTDFSKAVESFNKIGKGGAEVKKVFDEIEAEANKRAEIAAKKKADFIAPGALNPKQVQIGFASAKAEAGTAEAHSAILAAKGLQINAQAQMALDTKNTADNTGNLVGVAKAIHKTLTDQGAAAANVPATPNKI